MAETVVVEVVVVVVVVVAAAAGHIVAGGFVLGAEVGMVAAVDKAIVVAVVGRETAVAVSDTMVAVDVLAETVAPVVVGIAVAVFAVTMLGLGESILVGMVVVVGYATAAAQLVDSWVATVEEPAVVEERTVM